MKMENQEWGNKIKVTGSATEIVEMMKRIDAHNAEEREKEDISIAKYLSKCKGRYRIC